MKNETVHEEMVVIMEFLYSCVLVGKEQPLEVSGDVEPVHLQSVHFCQVLFDEDQLTVSRARGWQDIRDNSDSAELSFQGLVPVVEDWQAKGCSFQ